MNRKIKNKYPKTTDARITSRKAEIIFESLLPPAEWNVVKIHGENDFGIDYKIETVTDKELKGYECYIQLKGLEKIEGNENISISIPISTLSYWKNKIIPILIVAIDCANRKGYYQWFDKLIEIRDNQITQTVHIPIKNLMASVKLRCYLEAYYGGFIESYKDKNIYSFYKHLFYNSLLMSSAIENKLIALLYPPKLLSNDLEKHNEHYIKMYIMIFAKFVYDLKIYKINLPDTPFHNVLNQFIAQIFKLHEDMCLKETKENFHDIAEKYVITVDREKAYKNLPVLSKLFSDINLFFAKYLL